MAAKKELTAKQFVNMLEKCMTEWKSKSNETADDIDAAHFYDPKLKKFIEDNLNLINQIGAMRLNQSFMTFIHHYLLKDKS